MRWPKRPVWAGTAALTANMRTFRCFPSLESTGFLCVYTHRVYCKMAESDSEFVIDRRKAVAGLGMAGLSVVTGISFASDEDSTSEDISVEVDGGGVVDVATAAPASGDDTVDAGLGIEWQEVVTQNGGGVTGFAGDKSEDVLANPPYDDVNPEDYGDRVLFGAVLENPDDVNQFLDFTVTIGNVGEIANGDPYDFLTLELALEQIEDDDGDLEVDPDDDDTPTLDPEPDDGDPTGADALVEPTDDEDLTADPVDDPTEIVVGGEDDGTVTVSLTSPRARLRTRPAADFDAEDDFGGYRVIVTGGTASVRDIAGDSASFTPDDDFDADFDFSVE